MIGSFRTQQSLEPIPSGKVWLSAWDHLSLHVSSVYNETRVTVSILTNIMIPRHKPCNLANIND